MIKKLVTLFLLSMACMIAVLPTEAFAQDSVQELELNRNAFDFNRTNGAGRVWSEIGMGTLGLAISAGASFLLIYNVESDATYLFPALVTPALVGTGVYLGGMFTGGRSSAWAPYAGAYVGLLGGALTGGIIGIALAFSGCGMAAMASAIGITVVSVFIGAIVGYELSDSSNTDDLKSQREKLGITRKAMTPMPFTPTLFRIAF